MVELSRRAGRKTQQAVTEYLARTGRGPGGLDALRDGTLLLGKTLEAISAGSSGTVQVYAASRVKDTEVAKGDEEASGDAARQYECYSRGHSFASGDWCIIVRLGGTGMEIIPFSVASSPTSTGESWTIRQYDTVTGDVVRNFDRGRDRFAVNGLQRATTTDMSLLVSADDQYLYALGDPGRYPNPFKLGLLAKWDIATGENLWYTDDYVDDAFPSPTVQGGGTICDGCLLEASDGYIWVCSGPGASNTGVVARVDPDDGTFADTYGPVTNLGHQLLPCPTSGSVVVAQTTAAATKYIYILDSSASVTHSYGTAITAIEEHNGRLYCLTATTVVILDASDLSVIDSRGVTGGTDTYQNLVTDGTAVWVATTGTGPKFRSYDASNLATENWNASRDGDNVIRMLYDGSGIYTFGLRVRRISPSDGSEVWDIDGAPMNISTLGTCLARRSAILVGDYTLSCHLTNGRVLCLNKSNGQYGWTDTLITPQAVAATSDGAYVFASCIRTGPA